MTFQEITHQEVIKMTDNDPKYTAIILDSINNNIELLEKLKWEQIPEDTSPFAVTAKLLLSIAKAYGEAKWNEAIQAASNSFCSESPAPPKFIP